MELNMDQKTFWEKIKELRGSVKFWTMALGVFVIVLKTFVKDLPISEQELNNVVVLLAAYIVGRGLENTADLSTLLKIFFPSISKGETNELVQK